jgi:predicted Zn-dependent peptidase
MKYPLPVKITPAGFTTYVIPDAASKLVHACVVIRGGFYNEFSKKESGINHLFEHILCQSWRKCIQRECSQFWAERPVHRNAETMAQAVSYYITGLATETDDMLNYIVQIISNPRFDVKVVEAEKRAIMNELTITQNNPAHKLTHALFAHIVSGESGLLNKTDIQLQIDNLKRITAEDIVTYYKRFYNSNNITFFFSGKITTAQISAIMTKNFNNFKNLNPARNDTILVDPNKVILPSFKAYGDNDPKNAATNTNMNTNTNTNTNKSDFPLFILNKNAKNTEFEICIPANQSSRYDTKKMYHFTLCAEIARSELLTILRTKHKLVYGISVQHYASTGANIITISGSCQDADVLRVIHLCLQYYLDRQTHRVQDTVLAAAKGRFDLTEYRTIRTTADIMQYYESFFISFMHMNGDIAVNMLKVPFETPEQTLRHVTRASAADVMDQFRAMDVSRAVFGYIGKRRQH